MTQLLDITDDSNPLYITKGNPGLKPQFTSSLNAYYNNYIVRYKRSIVVYANYRHIRNSISNLVRYNPETVVALLSLRISMAIGTLTQV